MIAALSYSTLVQTVTTNERMKKEMKKERVNERDRNEFRNPEINDRTDTEGEGIEVLDTRSNE